MMMVEITDADTEADPRSETTKPKTSKITLCHVNLENPAFGVKCILPFTITPRKVLSISQIASTRKNTSTRTWCFMPGHHGCFGSSVTCKQQMSKFAKLSRSHFQSVANLFLTSHPTFVFEGLSHYRYDDIQ